MKIRTVLAAVLVSLLAAFLFRSSAFADFRMIVASDIHYIAPSITDGGACYQQALDNGDSKFMPYSEEICEAFLDEVLAERPDALLLTGDLTFNGAILSHEALAGKLGRLKEAGIPVLVTTGNHDVYNPNAAAFHGDSYTALPSADTDSFAEIYADFGLKEALYAAPDSLSYVWPVSESEWILVLDLNTAHDFCGISDDTLAWAEARLREASDKDIRVIACGHQNIFQHSIFRGGYVIDGADRLSALFREYAVPLYLSGHLHIQHVLEEDGLAEIATSALCSYPCQYGVLEAKGDRLSYSTRELDMASWAEKTGNTDPVFRDFRAAAAEYMTGHLKVETPVSAESGEMTDYIQRLNLAYFSGDLRVIEELDPDGHLSGLWMKDGDLFSLYVASVLADSGKDFTLWTGHFS